MSEKDKEYTIDYFEHQANEINKKYIEELDRVLAIYKRALELACKEIDANSKGLTNARFKIQKIVNDWGIGEQVPIFDFFIQQAKKELEEENGNN